jgi:hypothetical protein
MSGDRPQRGRESARSPPNRKLFFKIKGKRMKGLDKIDVELTLGKYLIYYQPIEKGSSAAEACLSQGGFVS